MRTLPRVLLAALATLTLAAAAAPAAPAPSFSFPLRLGFEAGDDWEPAIAADRFGLV